MVIVIIVVMDFRKNFEIPITFSVEFPGIFANNFQCKKVPVYSIYGIYGIYSPACMSYCTIGIHS